jgi:hypothetical protein
MVSARQLQLIVKRVADNSRRCIALLTVHSPALYSKPARLMAKAKKDATVSLKLFINNSARQVLLPAHMDFSLLFNTKQQAKANLLTSDRNHDHIIKRIHPGGPSRALRSYCVS